MASEWQLIVLLSKRYLTMSCMKDPVDAKSAHHTAFSEWLCCVHYLRACYAFLECLASLRAGTSLVSPFVELTTRVLQGLGLQG